MHIFSFLISLVTHEVKLHLSVYLSTMHWEISFTLSERACSYPLNRRLVGARAGMDTVVKRKKFLPLTYIERGQLNRIQLL